MTHDDATQPTPFESLRKVYHNAHGLVDEASITARLAAVTEDLRCQNDLDANVVLFYAAREGHASVCEWLLDRGADINTVWDERTTPLAVAAHNGHLEVCSLLAERGADVEGSEQHFSPLDMAAFGGQDHVAQWLLERGVDPDARKADGFPLYYAADNGNVHLCKRLLDAGADCNRGPAVGSPLLCSVSNRDEAVSNLLLDRGASASHVLSSTVVVDSKDKDWLRGVLSQREREALTASIASTFDLPPPQRSQSARRRM